MAFALLFLPAYIAVKLFARAVGGKARRSVLGPVDRLLGGGFGMLKGLIGATLFFLLANLATDMIYGGEADRPEWMTELAHLSAAQRQRPRGGRLGRGRAAHPGGEAVIRLYDTMARDKRRVRAGRSEAHHHVCLRADGLWPRPYRQCPAGGGVRHAAPRLIRH